MGRRRRKRSPYRMPPQIGLRHVRSSRRSTPRISNSSHRGLNNHQVRPKFNQTNVIHINQGIEHPPNTARRTRHHPRSNHRRHRNHQRRRLPRLPIVPTMPSSNTHSNHSNNRTRYNKDTRGPRRALVPAPAVKNPRLVIHGRVIPTFRGIQHMHVPSRL